MAPIELVAIARRYPHRGVAWQAFKTLGERIKGQRDPSGVGTGGFCAVDAYGRGVVTVLAPPGLVDVVEQAWPKSPRGEPIDVPEAEVAAMVRAHLRIIVEDPPPPGGVTERSFEAGGVIDTTGRIVPKPRGVG